MWENVCFCSSICYHFAKDIAFLYHDTLFVYITIIMRFYIMICISSITIIVASLLHCLINETFKHYYKVVLSQNCYCEAKAYSLLLNALLCIHPLTFITETLHLIATAMANMESTLSPLSGIHDVLCY